MASITTATTPAKTRVERYRAAELNLWHRHELEPTEQFLDLESPAASLRVVTLGSGRPVLFVHGTVGPGGWPSLIAELPGFRSIVLDRPGWGMSSAIDFSAQDYGALVAEIMQGVLDALEIEQAHVVGGSIGNVWALRLAERYPSRVDRVVLMGGGPIVDHAGVPRMIRLLASPVGALMVRLPAKHDRVHSILRRLGHGASLDAKRIPEEFVDWRVAAGRDTASMRHEREMVCAIVKGTSYRPGLTFGDAELAAIQQPTLHVYGTADPMGSTDLWRGVADTLPRGRLSIVEDAGHMPWFDDSTRVAQEMRDFLTSDAVTGS